MATQYGTIRLQTGAGTVSVPVFAAGSSGSSVYEFLRVGTPSGVGYIPLVDPADAAYPYLRIQTQNHGVLAVHDSSSVTQYVETFEDGDIAEYGGDTGYFSVNSIFDPEGTYGLEGHIDGAGNTRRIQAGEKSVSDGNTYKVDIQTGGDSRHYQYIMFGAPDDTTFTGYLLSVEPANSKIAIFRLDSGSATLLNRNNSVSISASTQYTIRFVWGSSGSLTFELYDSSGNKIGSTSATDSNYSSGGIGFRSFGDTGAGASDAYWDAVRSV